MGLTKAKMKKLKNFECDILFASETWYINHQEVMKDEMYLCSSSKGVRTRSTGHLNGGLVALCKNSLRRVISDIKVTEYYVAVCINSQWIVAVYFAPSLENSVIDSVLRDIPANTIAVFGDFNFRLGTNMDPIRRNIPRSELCIERLSSKRLHHVAASSRSDCDHLFSSQDIQWDYERLPVDIFQSDHGRMKFKIDFGDYSSTSNGLMEERSEPMYAFGELDKYLPLRSYFNSFWANRWADKLMLMVSEAEVFLKDTMTYEEAKNVIDSLYDMLLFSIEDTCAEVLPVYKRGEARETMIKNQSPQCAVRLFKQSRRRNTFIKSRNPDVSPEQECYQYFDKVFNSLGGQSENVYEARHEYLEHTVISPGELRKAILKYPKGKSSGPDRVDIRCLRCLSDCLPFMSVCSRIFALFMNCSSTPSQWNTASIHLIPKQKDSPYADKCRPVSLTQLLRRIFEKIVLSRWNRDQPDFLKLSNHQTGFRRGFSTTSGILVVDELLRKKDHKGLFLDFSCAYDRVPYDILLDKMERRGAPRHETQLIYSMFCENMRSVLIVNRNVVSIPLQRKAGLFQGSLLSPILFNIFIDDLATELNSIYPDCCHLFADDVALIEKEEILPDLLRRCQEWANRNKMVLNTEKSGSLADTNLFVETSLIPKLESYKYLGLPMTSRGVNWSEHMSNSLEKSKSIFNSVKVESAIWSPRVRMIIYKTFIRSAGEYCVALSWLSMTGTDNLPTILEEYEEFHDTICSWICTRQKTTKIAQNLTGLGTYSLRWRFLLASLTFNLQGMHPGNLLNIMKQDINALSGLGNRRFILKKLFFNKYFLRWMRRKRESRNGFSWTRFYSELFAEDQLNRNKLMEAYISKEARGKWEIDEIIKTDKVEISKWGLLWRMNRFCYGKTCEQGHPLTRRCFINCNLVGDDILEDSDISTMEAHKNKVTLGWPENTFSIMDHLLNTQQYKQFGQICGKLS